MMRCTLISRVTSSIRKGSVVTRSMLSFAFGSSRSSKKASPTCTLRLTVQMLMLHAGRDSLADIRRMHSHTPKDHHASTIAVGRMQRHLCHLLFTNMYMHGAQTQMAAMHITQIKDSPMTLGPSCHLERPARWLTIIKMITF